jgi:uncharacterized protein (DUF1499 family)
VPADEGWPKIRAGLEALPRTRIITATDNYLHAETRTRLLRFVDDTELLLRPGEGLVEVRAGARLGYSDLGVNRRRVEALRECLREDGVLAD